MYIIIKSFDMDVPQRDWLAMEYLENVEDILNTWQQLVDNLECCYPEERIQPCEDGHSPYEVTIGYDGHRLTLSAEVYISSKKIAYRLITE